jgi:hypothetical protein
MEHSMPNVITARRTTATVMSEALKWTIMEAMNEMISRERVCK